MSTAQTQPTAEHQPRRYQVQELPLGDALDTTAIAYIASTGLNIHWLATATNAQALAALTGKTGYQLDT